MCTTLLAVVASVSFEAEALSVDAFPLAVAVGDLAFVVVEVTLHAFPSREAPALALFVVPVAGAQYWTHA